ncbi:MAG: peptidylprolyl isomerase [Endomicrobium sp.]|jgi:parvulin-like peptidyl-prolyl isomerase|nr:peptidylprolyl isomerase [Endomicrobium sp.]
MKRLFAVLTTITFITLNTFAAPEVVDEVLATVNGEPIFASQFNKYFNQSMNLYKKYVPAEQISEQQIKALKNSFLAERTKEFLLIKEAKKQKIQISKKKIQDEINNIKKSFKNEAEFNSLLLKDLNMTLADFEKMFEERYIIGELLQKVVFSNVRMPTELELKSFYDKIITKTKNKNTAPISITDTLNPLTPFNNIPDEDTFTTLCADIIKKKFGNRVRIKHILISCPKNATASDIKAAREKVETVKIELQKKTFADVAKQYSDDPSDKSNSDSGLITVEEIDKIFPGLHKIIFDTNVGNYNKEPVKTEKGYHFIKVEERRASTEITLNNPKVKSDISEMSQTLLQLKALKEYIDNLSAKANIKINKTW